MRVLPAIAYQSWKQLVRDRIFYVVLIAAFFMVGFSYLLATLTIIEPRKVLLDFGFSAASFAGAVTAIYIGVVAVAREVEQKLVYAIVSKPVSRTGYLVGKFAGCLAVLFMAHVMLAITILLNLWLLQESPPAGFAACVFLIFLENLILLACAFLFSVFCGSFVAGALTFAVFLIGRSNPAFQTLAKKGITPGVRAFGKAAYSVLPNFERFNIRDVVAYGRPYPENMFWHAPIYCLAYVVFCLSLSAWIFSKRDLP